MALVCKPSMTFWRPLLFTLALAMAGVAAAAAWWLNQPLALTAESVELSIEPGLSLIHI
jgi:hypothetical protein